MTAGRQANREGGHMDTLFGLAVLAAIAWWFYKSGKRIGSRKGYNVGRSRSRRHRRR